MKSPKTKTIYSCQNCGCQSPKWMGRCPDCGQWSSMVEETFAAAAVKGAAVARTSSEPPRKMSEIKLEEKNRQLLTVHHKDGNRNNNPPDGSNWENLCVYCHEDEHSRGM